MSRAISIDTIADTCTDAILDAFDEYYEWTGGEWLWNAPEYFTTVNIAKALWH